MPRSLALIPLTLALSAHPALAADKPPIPLARVGAWEMNYGADSCQLLSRYSDGTNEIIASFTRYVAGDTFDLTFSGKPVKDTGEVWPKATIAFGDQAPQHIKALAGTADDKRPLLMFTGIRLDGSILPPNFIPPGNHPAITPEQEAATTSLTIKFPGGEHFRLETGSFAKPMAVMRACTSDLVKYWGYDLNIQSQLKQGSVPLSDPGTWFKPKDFPKTAMLRGQNALVQIRLDVTETGTVAGCHIQFRTKPDELADLLCKLITRRARFSPALDFAGKPVRSFYVTKIRWFPTAPTS